MEGLNYPEYDEGFLKKPSAVTEVIEFLEAMIEANKMEDKREGKKKLPKPSIDISASVTDESFLISCRQPGQALGRRSTRRTRSKTKAIANLNQFTFMRQIDQTPEERAQTRIERERVANSFRRTGNIAYRKEQIGIAIEMYTKGLEYIKDTPVLYINRACCHLRLRHFQRAIIDCDYILTKLDSKYLRAFLYKAIAYKRLNEPKNYEDCIYQAKRLNSRDLEFIDEFLESMRTM